MLTRDDIEQNILFVLNMVPLLAFLTVNRMYDSWKPAFLVGGLLALVIVGGQLALPFFITLPKQRISSFLLSVNLFLITGGVMYLFNVKWISIIYSYFMYTALFGWLTLVGVIATIASPETFIEIETSDPKLATKLSLWLTGACAGLTLFSWIFQANFFWAAWAPFILLMFIKDEIQVYERWSVPVCLPIAIQSGAVLLISLLFSGFIQKIGFLSFLLLFILKRFMKSRINSIAGK